ncbi:MAG: hypothetical protein ACFFCM_18695 [Promethearchaeota archaeon]
MKKLSEGIFRGTAITDAHYCSSSGTALSFFVELDEKILGIPSQLPVFCHQYSSLAIITRIKEGDKVLLKCKIMRQKLKTWNKEVNIIIAKNIFNESRKLGF